MDQRKEKSSTEEATSTGRWGRSSVVVILLIALIGIGCGVLFYKWTARPPLEILFPTASPAASTEFKVYVSGAVAHPGVYTLRPGDRVVDAIDAAGGPTENADLTRINLAAKVKDEQQVHIPKFGESAPQGSSDQTRLVNINTAPAELLETLPGIGKTKAQAIINYRQEHGDFKRIEDLVEVAGIGYSTYENLKHLITVD
jgi:competence protein ComEA